LDGRPWTRAELLEEALVGPVTTREPFRFPIVAVADTIV
jgi:hypothetical protein